MERVLRRDCLRGHQNQNSKDLSVDSRELNDVMSEHPDIVTKMEKMMKEAHKTPTMDIFKIPVLENDK